MYPYSVFDTEGAMWKAWMVSCKRPVPVWVKQVVVRVH